MTRSSIDVAIEEIASRQCLAFSRGQVHDNGGTDELIKSRLLSGWWLRPAPGVYSLPGWRPSFDRSLWVAHLGAGTETVIAFQAAAALHPITGFPPGSVVLLARNGQHHRVAGATIRQTRDPWPPATVEIRGLPVTTPARTFVDLARFIRPGHLKVALEDARVARLVSYEEVGLELASLARPGKPGVRKLAAALGQLRGEVPSQSELERGLFGLHDRFGGQRLTRQHAHPGERVDGCTDGTILASKLIVESDGRPWHTRIQDIKRDHERDQQAAKAGYLTLRLLHEHVVGDPYDSWRTIEQTHAVRMAQFGSGRAA